MSPGNQIMQVNSDELEKLHEKVEEAKWAFVYILRCIREGKKVLSEDGKTIIETVVSFDDADQSVITNAINKLVE